MYLKLVVNETLEYSETEHTADVVAFKYKTYLISDMATDDGDRDEIGFSTFIYSIPDTVELNELNDLTTYVDDDNLVYSKVLRVVEHDGDYYNEYGKINEYEPKQYIIDRI